MPEYEPILRHEFTAQDGSFPLQLRCDLTRDQAALAKPIDTATGVKPDIDIGAKPSKGGWDGALLNEPITIPIGPAQEKKK